MEKVSPLRRLEKTLSVGNMWLYILSLSGAGGIYAYALNEGIKKKFGFSPSRLMCYIVLYKLEAEGLISSKFMQRRKYYFATAKGRKALLEAKGHLRKIAMRL